MAIRKNKTPLKIVILDKAIHAEAKDFCKQEGLVLGRFANRVIREALDKAKAKTK